jgi:hypothetical protein
MLQEAIAFLQAKADPMAMVDHALEVSASVDRLSLYAIAPTRTWCSGATALLRRRP